jgi:chitin synthase
VKSDYDSRPASAYGYAPSRGVSPAASYQDLRPHSQFANTLPQLPYQSPAGSFAPLPGNGMDNRSFHAGSMYGGDARSAYAGSMYGQPQHVPVLDHRASNYSLGGPRPGTTYDPRQSSYSYAQQQQQPQYADTRHSSYSYASPLETQDQPQPQSRPLTSYLPELATHTAVAPISLGEAGITDAQLEVSIRRICQGADLEVLTQKGVRKQLEEEFGVGLGARKEGINAIIQRVLAG